MMASVSATDPPNNVHFSSINLAQSTHRLAVGIGLLDDEIPVNSMTAARAFPPALRCAVRLDREARV
jgi:hypothetical protein